VVGERSGGAEGDGEKDGDGDLGAVALPEDCGVAVAGDDTDAVPGLDADGDGVADGQTVPGNI